MLVLTRRPGEKIVINDNVTVEIVEVRGNKVRLGITAARHVPVARHEVWVPKEPAAASAEGAKL